MKENFATMFRIAVITLALTAFGFSSAGAQETKEPRKMRATKEAHMQHGHKGHGDWGYGILKRMSRKLDLTEAQKEEIKAILAEERTKIDPLLAELRKNREELRSISKDGSFNEAEVRAVATRQAATLTELIVAKQHVKFRTYSVLTDEQRAKAEKMLDSHKSRRGRSAR